MNFVVFGLSISSSWGNGHATIWRGLVSSLTRMKHNVVFFERDVEYYASNRDFEKLNGLTLILYKDWNLVRKDAENFIKKADICIITSYCPDAVQATELLNSFRKLKVFYDLDTPVTLKNIEDGKWPSYIPQNGLGMFDLVLSYTGGNALNRIREVFGVKLVFPLYGSADPQLHYPTCQIDKYSGDLSYLGTYAKDRQLKLEELFIKPAVVLKNKRFILAGAQYPNDIKLTDNITFLSHVAPPEHSCFYCSSNFTLNITRSAMATMGYCASGRLFEAALCEVPILSDWWVGMDTFFYPGEEIIVVKTAMDVIEAMSMNEKKRQVLTKAARRRVLREHTAEKRAQELIAILNRV
ncbi:MAG TPA: glycosyltransferase [Chitinispirillaceae bacterium]|nr:glycosyltransferase [Chitinispirillaceae bacterium]